MNWKHLVGGVGAAAVLVGGGFGLDAAAGKGGGGNGPAYGAYATPGPTPAAPGSLHTTQLTPGTALVDGAGRTLYLFEADSATMSNCAGGCASVWPPLLVHGTQVMVSGAARSGLVGSVARADGTRQVTYAGHPLYSYVGDRTSGDAHGQGLQQFGAGWYVVAPSGAKVDPDG